jgi:hypothetical protein
VTYIGRGLGYSGGDSGWSPTGATDKAPPAGYSAPYGVRGGLPVDPRPYMPGGSGAKGGTIPWATYCTLFPHACPQNWREDPGPGGTSPKPARPAEKCPPGYVWKFRGGKWVCLKVAPSRPVVTARSERGPVAVPYWPPPPPIRPERTPPKPAPLPFRVKEPCGPSG